MVVMINDELIKRIESIDFFKNIGRNGTIDFGLPVEYVESLVSAQIAYNDISWENIQLDHSNELTVFLHDRYNREYNMWNALVKDVKARLSISVLPMLVLLQKKYELDAMLVHTIMWDLLHAAMEDAYSQCKHSFTFYKSLLSVYEAGHFPCGWRGDFKNGTLLVY